MNCEAVLSLIVALDFPELDSCRKILEELKGLVKIYKVGSELFTAEGWRAVELVRQSGAEVFLDLKLHDIPTTVAKTARVIAKHDVFMSTVHALGGLDRMREAKKALDESSKGRRRPLLVGVTILTSHKEADLSKELGIPRPLKEEVLVLARLAKEAGLDGVVCSPEEIGILKKALGEKFILVTPGIRPAGVEREDQSRVMTPREALQKGAHYLIIGRPVTAALHPRRALEEILKDWQSQA